MNKITKNIILGSCCLSLVLFILILTNPLNIGKTKGSIYDKVPANKAFKDFLFYNEVVMQYLLQNNFKYKNYDVYDNSVFFNVYLTDEELATISSINISSEFKDLSGLEKLTGLKQIVIRSIEPNKIDLSNQKKLQELKIEEANFENLDLSKLLNLTDLKIKNSNIKKIKIPKEGLKNVVLNNLDIEYIDLSYNTNIINLDLSNNKLTEIFLPKNNMLTTLNLSNNKLTNVDLSKVPNLVELDLSSNELVNIDLSNNSNLTKLNLNNNKLSSLDISKIKFENSNFQAAGNKIENLILGENSYGFIKNQSKSLKNISFGNEKISIISNKVSFTPGELLLKKEMSIEEFLTCFDFSNYSGNIRINDKNIENVTTPITQGMYITIDGLGTFYFYIFSEEEIDYTLYESLIGAYNSSNNANYTTQHKLTDEELRTIKTLNLNLYYETDLSILEKLTNLTQLYINNIYGINYMVKANFDLSNLEKLESVVLENIQTDTIKIQKSKGLKDFNINNIKVKSLYLNNTKITNLSGTVYGLENIDIYNNEELIRVSLNGLKKIKSVNLSGSINIENITLEGANLNSIDLTGLNKIKTLDLSKNNLTEISTLESECLTELDLSGNNFETINLAKFKDLRILNLEENNLTTIDLRENKNIVNVELSDNINLGEIKGLKDTKITELFLSYVNLKELDLSNNKSITYISFTNLNLFPMELLDISGCENLTGMTLISFDGIKNMIGFDETSNLNSLIIGYMSPKNLDLSKLNNLKSLILMGVEVSNSIGMLKGTEIDYEPVLKTPSIISYKTYNEDDGIISLYDEKIKALEVGQSAITSFFRVLNVYNSSYIDMPARLYVNVFDVYSNKYEINKESKYIFVGNEENDKTINRYVKISGENLSKKLSNDILKIISNEEVIEEFKIIKVTSKEYSISNDTIEYYGEFNLNNINVTNVQKEISNNKLLIKYNDIVIKEYDLKKY